MVKHVSLNSHELNKFVLDAQIEPAAHRESELLGFQIATERGNSLPDTFPTRRFCT